MEPSPPKFKLKFTATNTSNLINRCWSIPSSISNSKSWLQQELLLATRAMFQTRTQAILLSKLPVAAASDRIKVHHFETTPK